MADSKKCLSLPTSGVIDDNTGMQLDCILYNLKKDIDKLKSKKYISFNGLYKLTTQILTNLADIKFLKEKLRIVENLVGLNPDFSVSYSRIVGMYDGEEMQVYDNNSLINDNGLQVLYDNAKDVLMHNSPKSDVYVILKREVTTDSFSYYKCIPVRLDEDQSIYFETICDSKIYGLKVNYTEGEDPEYTVEPLDDISIVYAREQIQSTTSQD